MSNLKVTVVTLTLNSEKYLAECIGSVLSQTYKIHQYIIKDGVSTDGTISLARSISSSIQVIQKKDNGIYSAFNQSLKEVTGDITIFVHADDMLADNAVISDIVNRFVSTDCDVVFGDIEIINPENKKVVRYWRSSNFQYWKLYFGWMPPHTALAIKNSTFQKVGKFDESFQISGDYDYILRLFTRDDLNFQYIPRLITKMRAGGSSNKNIRSFIVKFIEDYRIAKKFVKTPFVMVLCKKIRKITQFVVI